MPKLNSRTNYRLLALVGGCFLIIALNGAFMSALLDMNPLAVGTVKGPRFPDIPFIGGLRNIRVGVAASLAGAVFQSVWFGLVIMIIPDRTRRIAQTLQASPAKLLQLFAVGILAALSAIVLTVLGLYSDFFGPSLPALFIVLMLTLNLTLGSVIFAFGHFIARKLGLAPLHPLLEVFVGALILFVFFSIPYIGFAILVAVLTFAIGAGITTRLGDGHTWDFQALSLRLSLDKSSRENM